MATRSRIGLVNEDRSVTSIYVHWDGHPDTRMPILEKSYSSEDSLKTLLSHGSISELRDSITETIFYHRDRSEPLDIRTSRTIEEFFTGAFSMSEEYVYLFDNNRWIIRS